LNQSDDEIEAVPLYYFSYLTHRTTFIRDLKDYEIDVKGGADNFIIYGYGKEKNLEIKYGDD